MRPEHKNILNMRRVLLAIDSTAGCELSMDTAIGLAHQLQVDLVGLFVEDINLINLAGLPFQQHEIRPSGAVAHLDLFTMERSLKKMAQNAHKMLRVSAKKTRVNWSFQVARGRLITELIATAQEADLLIIGRRSDTSIQQLEIRHTARKQDQGMRGTILVLYDGSDVGKRALLAARQISVEQGRDLEVFFIVKKGASTEALQQQAAEILGDISINIYFRNVKVTDEDALIQTVRKANPIMLVLGMELTTGKKQLVEQLSIKLPCPLIVVEKL